MPVFFQPQQLMAFTRVEKASDTSRSSTTTATADPELVLAVAANSSYEVRVITIVQGATGDTKIKVGWTYPVGTTIKWTYDSIVDTALNPNNSVYRYKLEETGTATGLCDSSQDAWYEMKGLVEVGSTAGNLSVAWAQSTSDANATKMLAQSEMRLIKTA